jgi:flagellar hook-length control protein FliK
MLVKLQPEQLGNVELKLNIHKGLVMAEIKVENEIVKAAIESNLDDLRQNLSNKGFTVNQINVSVDTGKKEHQQEMFEFQSNKKSGKNAISSIGEEDQDTEMMIQNYGYDEGNSSTINYLG